MARAEVSPRDVEALGAFTQALETRLGRAAPGPGAARAQADCMLERFDAHGGRGAQDALMAMMERVASTSEFDDPVVVRFNDAYGTVYAQALRQCAP
ncbi:MAG: hypothetical protein AAFR93_07715 [Pseudomonadota bacterium]